MRKIGAMWIIIPLVAVVFLFVIAAAVLMSKREQSVGRDQVQELYRETEYTEYKEKWQEGTISYKGHEYLYSNENKIFLLMGIDKNEKVHVKEGAGADGGCSDAMFLLVQNKRKKALSIVSINRNTMTKVAVYSPEGRKIGYYTLQLCLQHAYGDGGRSSCARSVEAVSYLFRDLPISGYMALNMAGIPKLNDAVSGVPVKVTEEMKQELPELNLEVGEERVLYGREAVDFLRNRDQGQFDSATDRLERQEEYLTGLFSKIKSTVREDQKKAVKLFEALEEYLVTNMEVRTIIGEWIDHDYDPNALWTVPGKTVMGDVYEEYRVDEDKLKEQIMDHFYTRIDGSGEKGLKK